jgi:hypothetical protein
MHFGTKNYLKSTHNHTAKHALKDYKNVESIYQLLASCSFLYFKNI